jgi:hypothetical protein
MTAEHDSEGIRISLDHLSRLMDIERQLEAVRTELLQVIRDVGFSDEEMVANCSSWHSSGYTTISVEGGTFTVSGDAPRILQLLDGARGTHDGWMSKRDILRAIDRDPEDTNYRIRKYMHGHFDALLDYSPPDLYRLKPSLR